MSRTRRSIHSPSDTATGHPGRLAQDDSLPGGPVVTAEDAAYAGNTRVVPCFFTAGTDTAGKTPSLEVFQPMVSLWRRWFQQPLPYARKPALVLINGLA